MSPQHAVLETVNSPRKPAPAAVTRSIDFKFASEERVKYHADVLEPARRARMSLAEREKLVRQGMPATHTHLHCAAASWASASPMSA